MRKKYAALLLGAALGLSLLNGCQGAKQSMKKGGEISHAMEDANAIYGEVSQISDSGITIKIGTRKERDQSQKDKPSDEHSGEMPSMLELTGEEQEIKVTDETVIKRRQMGGGRGNWEENGEPPELPSGEKPEKEIGDGELPEREMGDVQAEERQRPDGGAAEEAITLGDISEGDTIAVVLGEDGSAEEISVLSGRGPGGAAPASQPEEDQAVKDNTKDIQEEGANIASEGTDENAVLISERASAELKNVTITRSSKNSTGGDQGSFYGVGAAVLATEWIDYQVQKPLQFV